MSRRLNMMPRARDSIDDKPLAQRRAAIIRAVVISGRPGLIVAWRQVNNVLKFCRASPIIA